MGENSKIEWTDATVNFWWGCTKVSPGCDHCYAETWSNRFGKIHWGAGAPRRKIKSAVTLLHKLDNDYAWWAADYYAGALEPYSGPRRRIFIQSMSDMFDKEVPVEWFDEAWKCIEICDRVSLQIVTKRISYVEKRLAEIGRASWPQHAGLIISVVNQEEADRDIPRLLITQAKMGIPWVGLSIEPMLGPVDIAWALSKNRLDIAAGILRRGHFSPGLELLQPIAWVICGGESGPAARPMHPAWEQSIREQCALAGVPYFRKQWGEWLGYGVANGRRNENCGLPCEPKEHHDFPDGTRVFRVGKKAAGSLLDGVEHKAFPV